MTKAFYVWILIIMLGAVGVAAADSLPLPQPINEITEPYVGDDPAQGPQIECICQDVWSDPVAAYQLELTLMVVPKGVRVGPTS